MSGARAADPDDEQLLPALRVVGSMEAQYAGPQAVNLGQVEALEPVRQLRALAERIGRSTDTWQKAWQGMEVLDNEGALLQSHLNVCIAGLAQLPDGAYFVQGGDDSAGSSEVRCCAGTDLMGACLQMILVCVSEGKVIVSFGS